MSLKYPLMGIVMIALMLGCLGGDDDSDILANAQYGGFSVTKNLTTNSTGGSVEYFGFTGAIDKIFVDLGTVTTAGDLTFSDQQTGQTFLTITNIGSDSTYYPVKQDVNSTNDPVASYSDVFIDSAVKVELTNGGDSKESNITIFYRR